jgi:hypothetical protein
MVNSVLDSVINSNMCRKKLLSGYVLAAFMFQDWVLGVFCV